MRRYIVRAVLGGMLAIVLTQQVFAQTVSTPPAWPRTLEKDGNTIVIYQPQVDGWDDYRTIHFRAAMLIRKKGSAEGDYAAVTASATTWVNQQERTVLIGPRRLEEFRVPGAKPEVVEELRNLMLAMFPNEQTITIDLDRLIAAATIGEQLNARQAQVSFDPPVIYASQVPAILVTFAGKPRYQQVPGLDLMYVVNTNWDLFFEGTTSEHFLLAGDCWLTTKDPLKGPWTLAMRLPAGLASLPADDNWKDVRANLVLKKPKTAPVVFTSKTPAELIVTAGQPQFELIAGTRLMRVSNTDSELFYHAYEKQYYFLTAGRWFRSKYLDGPWTSATKDLPSDFAKIPEDHDDAAILASVSGTQQAVEAVIQASIPQTAVVNRKDVTVSVVYQGQPSFVVIDGTTVSYAVNTPFSVFAVEGRYYCCHDGIWFLASSPSGPWVVADAVPAAIYAIPPTHPLYNVTYVYVYDSTPETVVVGVTSGYSGQYIAGGVVVFGAGVVAGVILVDDDEYWYYHYHTAYFSYGCGVYYSHYHGGYYCAGYGCYGPYGGAGAWAAYNPETGVYARGAYRYGPAGTASVRQAYNPWTGNYGARVNVNTPYGSWGRSVVTNGEDWAKAGHRGGPGGGVAGVVTSEGAGVIAGRGRYGEGAAVAKNKEGDVYVGHDGNIYRRDSDGGWSKRDDGQWNPVESAKPATRPGEMEGRTRPTEARPSQIAPPDSRQISPIDRDLGRQAQSRDRGTISSQEAQQRRANPPSARGSRGASAGRLRGR